MMEKQILTNIRRALIGMLNDLDPITHQETFARTINYIRDVTNLIHSLWWEEDCGPTTNAPVVTPQVDYPEKEPEPSVEEFKPPIMTTPEPAPAEPEEKPSFTKEEVRAALARARKKGANITEILGEFGAENFTGLPAARYGEVMAKLESL